MTILLRQITQGQQISQALLSPPPQPPRIEGPSRSCGLPAIKELINMEEIKTKDGGIILIKDGIELRKLNHTQANKPSIIKFFKVNLNTNNPTYNLNNLNLKGAFMHEQREFHKKQDAYMATIAEALSHLTFSPPTTQNAQQASTSSGLPSQPQQKPKGSISAITLRSGT
ncbi:hypothetical protein AHAS_Ahas03G0208600 [Arachis hypogaea]